jgi:hypothetical protein
VERKPRNNRREWTKQDNKVLSSLYKDKVYSNGKYVKLNLGVKDIAKKLDRSVFATIKQASRLGVTHWSK